MCFCMSVRVLLEYLLFWSWKCDTNIPKFVDLFEI